MTSTPLTRLEQSFTDIAAANRLTRFAVTYCGEQYGEGYRFSATGHFDDAAEGRLGCASGEGASTNEAIGDMLRQVDSKRTISAMPALYSDEPLIVEAA